jgi:outer membrane protein TolC
MSRARQYLSTIARILELGATLGGLLMPASGQQSSQSTASLNSTSPITLTLLDALARARANEPQYHAALTQYAVARQNRIQARAALLPDLSYNAGFLYTQGNNTSTGRYIGQNGVHEYISEGNAHQAISFQNVAEYRLASAEEVLAKAESQVATRGLVVTVVEAYYGCVVAQRKYSTAQGAAAEAQHFFDITQKLERGGEVAHSDTIKGQLQLQQQQRVLQEAELEMERSRLELAVLIFPNFSENFATVDDLQTVKPLPSFQEVGMRAGQNNPQLAMALAALKAANQEVAVAWNSLLPSINLNYFYGIDASRFAVDGFDPVSGRSVRNLGYAATATLEFPIWNWGASRSKVKSASYEREQTKLELSFAQRKMLADLKTLYSESQAARSQIDGLRQSADLAAESLRLTTLRYQAGEASALEVVDAQNTLTMSQNALGDGELRFRVAVANLQTLTGQF